MKTNSLTAKNLLLLISALILSGVLTQCRSAAKKEGSKPQGVEAPAPATEPGTDAKKDSLDAERARRLQEQRQQ